MKKLISLLISLILLLTACGDTSTKAVFKKLDDQREKFNIDYDKLTSYQGEIDVNPYNNTFKGKLEVSYFLTEAMDKVYLHLFLNAFTENYNPKPYNRDDKNKVFFQGYDTGYINIDYIKIGDQPVEFQVTGTILEINLPKRFKEGTFVNLNLGFNAKVPHIAHRVGYNDHAMWLGNWLPIMAVKDNSGWNLDPYYAMGDPFYSKMAKYIMTIRTPRGYDVAVTGASKTLNAQDDKRLTYVQTEPVRDLALWISNNAKINSKNTKSDVTLNLYTYDNVSYADSLLKILERAIAYYDNRLGPYPYKELDIVENEMIAAGMEYPGLIQISGNILRESKENAIFVLVHELAHQWCYNTIGNDQVSEPWIDEALTSYLTYEFFEFLLTEKEKEKMWLNHEKRLKEIILTSTGTIGSPITDFLDEDSYGALVYEKGTLMFKTLRNEMGEATFSKFLNKYYQEYAGKEINRQDFIALVSQVSGKNYTEFFNHWLDK